MGALRGQLPNDTAKEMSGPIKAKLMICAQATFAEDIDGIVIDVNEAKVLIDGSGYSGGLSHAPVVSDPFKPIKGGKGRNDGWKQMPSASEARAQQGD
jgi:hypothetical protein